MGDKSPTIAPAPVPTTPAAAAAITAAAAAAAAVALELLAKTASTAHATSVRTAWLVDRCAGIEPHMSRFEDPLPPLPSPGGRGLAGSGRPGLENRWAVVPSLTRREPN